MLESPKHIFETKEIISGPKSWIERMKNAIAGLVFAPLLCFASFHMLKHVEIEYGVITVALKKIYPSVKSEVDSNPGDIIHLTDILTSPEQPLIDKETGLRVRASKLYRKVYKWQWVEHIITTEHEDSDGNRERTIRHEYKKEWIDDLRLSKHDSDHQIILDQRVFKHKENHENPIVTSKYKSKLFTHSEPSKFGEYTLSPEVNRMVLNFQFLPIYPYECDGVKNAVLDTINRAQCPSSNFHAALRNHTKEEITTIPSARDDDIRGSNFKQGIFIGSGTPEFPELGDHRIEYWFIPDDIYTLVGRRTFDDQIIPVKHDSLMKRVTTSCGSSIRSLRTDLFLLYPGVYSKQEVFSKSQRENNILAVVLRFFGLFIMVAGFALFGNPLRLLFGWIPFIGKIWEKLIFKLMQVLGTAAALGISGFYFLQNNSIRNLSVIDLYFLVGIILFLIFVNNMRITISSNGKEVFHDSF